MGTGCALLDSKGVGQAEAGIRLNTKAMLIISDEEVVQYCVNCKRHACRLDDREGREFFYRVAVYHKGVEYVYQCTKCGEVETLTFRDGKMDNTRKFFQVGDKVYHTTSCGECRKVGSSL